MAPPRRPYWQGHIRLALVSIPVQIFTATRSDAGFSFHMVHAPSGKRVRYEKVVEGVGPVDGDDIMKGYEYEKDEYVLLEPEELEAVRLESRKTLELRQFVERDDIDPARLEKPYHVLPADDLAEEAYGVLRDALAKTGRVGIGQLAMRGREDIVALYPVGRGLLLETLRYDDELHSADDAFKSVSHTKPGRELIDMATAIINQRASDFDLSGYADKYGDAVRDLVQRKMKAKGRRITIDRDDKDMAPDNVIDLMAAFKKSLQADAPKAAAKRKRRA